MCKNGIRHVYWAAFCLFAVCSDSCGRTGTVSVLRLIRWGGIQWKLIFKAQLKHHGFVREMMMMMTMLIMMMVMETVVVVVGAVGGVVIGVGDDGVAVVGVGGGGGGFAQDDLGRLWKN